MSETGSTPSRYNSESVTSSERLEPISPETAVNLYLRDRKNELRESSIRQHESALRFFCKWCSQTGIENLNELTGRKLNRYRIWRRDEASNKVNSLATETWCSQLKILRLFIIFCESIDAVDVALHEKIRIPSLNNGGQSSDAIIEPEVAADICSYLRKYEYASLEHVIWTILTETGIRTGTLRSLDVDDYFPDAEISHLRIRNREETGTPLKNGDAGDRLVAIGSDCCGVIDDYLETTRLEEEDEYGRQPMLTAGFGRLSKSTIRRYVYKWTRPCAIGKGCPHDRDPETCEGTEHGKQSKCPSSEAAHALRRGYITHELKSGVTRSFVSQRCDVTEDVIEQHYDERDEKDKLRVRYQGMTGSRDNKRRYGS
ncbi:tyrosine-type recombinase/integrase [Haloferax massiliensis]|uniref:Tyrosine recombinase XerC n=1 Tax=Haloferax massiliensis TaxID=1476858 RepID=A0A0D6JMB6_9EURY|nr:site-specific integrase [Haloferax massiliensis]CQR49036.1 Tyrosine recombinase XerC [Haloferax massiliensis]